MKEDIKPTYVYEKYDNTYHLNKCQPSHDVETMNANYKNILKNTETGG